MKRVTKLLCMVLVLAMSIAMFAACGKDDDDKKSSKSPEEKQKDYEALLKDISKVDFVGKGMKMNATQSGVNVAYTVSESKDLEMVMGSDKVNLTIISVGGKSYMKGFVVGEDGQKQEFAYRLPEGSDAAEQMGGDIDSDEFFGMFKDENGNAKAEAKDVKYEKTEGGKDYVKATIIDKENNTETPVTLLFAESSQKLAGMIMEQEGQTMNMECGNFSVSANDGEYKDGSEAEIFGAMMGAMAMLQGE